MKIDQVKPSGEGSSKTVSPAARVKKRTAIVCGVLISAALGALAGADQYFVRSGQIARGVSVAGVDLSGYSRQPAEDALARAFPAPQVLRLVSDSGTASLNIPASSVHLQYDYAQAVEEAFAVGRQGGFFSRFSQRSHASHEGVRIGLGSSFNRQALAWVLDNTARKRFDVEAVDARLSRRDGTFIRTPEKPGRAVDVQQTLKLASALEVPRPVTTLELKVRVVTSKPKITLADIQNIDTLLATYTTTYRSGQAERTNNLVLASRSINGTLVKPGGVFSYNDTVGPRLKKHGYKDAYIFINGRVEPGTGGGICQVSSTLYNAALLSGMKIRQRSHHSMRVVYVPAGLDATVAYGVLDFRFENPFRHPVYIEKVIGGGRLTTNIYGAAADRQDIRIVRKESGDRPYGIQLIPDPSLPPGVRKVKEKGINGRDVVVQRVFRNPDGTERVETVSRDKYQPHNALVLVGPGGSSAPATGTAQTGASSQRPAQTAEDAPQAASSGPG